MARDRGRAGAHRETGRQQNRPRAVALGTENREIVLGSCQRGIFRVAHSTLGRDLS